MDASALQYQAILRLQEITAALSEALTPTQVAEVFLNQGVSGVGAGAGSVVMLLDPDTLEIIRSIGYPSETSRQWQTFPSSAPVPLAQTVKSGRPIWIESIREWQERYPSLPPSTTRWDAWATLPLIAKNQTIGALGFSFERNRPFSGEEKAFMIAAAYQCAQALERARLYAAEQTARAQAEAARSRINSILESISDGFASLDNDLRFTYVNQRAEQLLRNTRQQMLGHTVSEVFPGFIKSPLYEQIQRAMNARITTEYELESQNLAVSLHIRIYPFEGGLSLYLQDVTESRRNKQNRELLAEISTALATSIDYEQTLETAARLIIPRLADGCVIDLIHENGNIQPAKIAHTNPAQTEAAQKFFSRYPRKPDALRGAPAVIRTNQAEINPRVTDTMLQNAARDAEHLELLRQMGLSSSIVVPMRVNGMTIGALTLSATESRRVFTQADVPLFEEIAYRIALAIANARLYRQAQAAIENRDEFLSVAAHELKTPVTSLRGFAQLLLRELAKRKAIDYERLETSLNHIDLQSSKLSDLISKLLDVSRLQAGRLILETQTVDLVALVSEVTQTLQRTTAKHTLTLSAPPTLSIECDPLRLEQVIVNLLTNAIKYSPDGGAIEILISTPDANSVQIAVTDHGIGIPPERRGRLFQRFYQAHGEGYLGGIGLGLYISHEIIDLHHGQLQAEFPAQGGTRFVIELPIAS